MVFIFVFTELNNVGARTKAFELLRKGQRPFDDSFNCVIRLEGDRPACRQTNEG
ncbi:hypothetical protein LZ31DRAFT_555407 [Colletotrichum somersetense]|nr:hypothetical protein LZ31DRAFT_555407 [Colletotrichum somersetense]